MRAIGWSGSAALGGWLVDHYGYEISFVATAIGTSVGTAMRIPLLFIVEDRRGPGGPAPGSPPRRAQQRPYATPPAIPPTPNRAEN